MPDAWEIAKGLNENNATDRNGYDLNVEYTNLEVYLNGILAGDTEPPSAPTGLVVEADNESVSLDWDDNTDLDLYGYNIYRTDLSDGDYALLDTAPPANSSYLDTTVSTGVTYFYVVTAVDTSSNESDYSDEQFATPIDLAFYGDTNGDKQIDLIDLPDFVAVWLASDCLTTSGWDLNGDCVVNYEEFSWFAGLWVADFIVPESPMNVSAAGGDGYRIA